MTSGCWMDAFTSLCSAENKLITGSLKLLLWLPFPPSWSASIISYDTTLVVILGRMNFSICSRVWVSSMTCYYWYAPSGGVVMLLP